MAYFRDRPKSTLISVNVQRNRLIVKDYGSPTASTTGEDTDADEGMISVNMRYRISQMSNEAFNIVKAMHFIRDGNQTACIAGLSILMDCDWNDDLILNAILHENGLEYLVNLLEVNDLKVRIAAMNLMRRISQNNKIINTLILMGIVPSLLDLLNEHVLDELILICEILTNVAHKRTAARAVRKKNKVQRLVSFVDLKKEILIARDDSLTKEEKLILSLGKAAAHALWKLSRFSKIRKAMTKTGIVPILSQTLLVGKKSIVLPMVGLLCECSSLAMFQLAIETEGLVGVLLKDAQSGDKAMRRLCCTALMGAADGNASVRHTVRQHGGPRVLTQILANCDHRDYQLLSAVLGAIWKVSISTENVNIFKKLGVVRIIVPFLDIDNTGVLKCSAGALAELGKDNDCCEEMVHVGAVPKLVHILARLQTELLPNVAHAIGQCARDKQGIAEIQALDAQRLLWSLLKHTDRAVRVNSAWAIEPCVKHAQDSGEHLRCLTGSLVLVCRLLGVDDVDLLTPVCNLVAQVALDEENLGVMSDQRVADLLSNVILKEGQIQRKHELDKEEDSIEDVYPQPRIVHSRTEYKPIQKEEDPTGLRRHLCMAVANVCAREENRRCFGRRGVIPSVIQFLHTRDAALRAQACRALHALSFDERNCVTMHACGVVPQLLRAVADDDQTTQLAAAGCLYNLRQLLLAADYSRCGAHAPRKFDHVPV